MKKIIILLLALSALAACNKNNQKGEFPPYRISETNADSIVETITYKEYLKEKRKINRYNRIVLNDDYTKKEQQASAIKAFADLVRNKKLNHELNYLGITVTEEEQFDFVQGTNIHPAIKGNPVFKNPSTGEFDKSKVQPFIDKLEQNNQSDPFFVWNYQLNQIENEIKQKKYESLLNASYFQTDAYTNWLTDLISKKSSINIATLPYKAFYDSITIEEDDYRSFLAKKSYNYQIYERRYIKAAHIPTKIHKHFHEKEYKTFDRLIKSQQSFKKIAELSQFIKRFSSYYYENAIPEELRGFFKSAKPEDVYGPYFTNNSFRAIKLQSIKNIAERAWAHHLLIKNSNQQEVEKIKQDLISKMKEGRDFLEMAQKYTEKNPDKMQWGDTEWFRYAEMEEDFSDSTFMNSPGEVVLAKTRYGWHIINIKKQGKKRKRYFFTALYRPLEASDEDIKATKQEAAEFANAIDDLSKFEDKARENQYIMEEYEAQALDVEIRDLPNTSRVLKWAFNAHENDISKPFVINKKVYLFQIHEIGGPGTMPLRAAKDFIMGNVQNIKVKDFIKESFNIEQRNKKPIGKSIKKLNMNQHRVKGITFAQKTIANVGTDPYITGLATTLKPTEQTKLLFGEEHLFTLTKLSEEYSTKAINYIENKRKEWSSLVANGDYQLMFRLHDNLTVNLKRQQDSYFLLPKYEDTLKNDLELSAQMYKAEQAFRAQNYNDALNGKDDFKGFAELVKNEPSKQQRLAALYAGLSALQLNQFNDAIEYLKSVSTNDRFFSVVAMGAQGDALSQQGKYTEALKKYKQAINTRSNFVLAPRYILKMVAIHIRNEDYNQALKSLKIIEEQYPQSIVNKEIEKYIGHVEYFAKKTSILTDNQLNKY